MRAYGFDGVFLLLNFLKMNYESKNEWYLTSVKLIRALETGTIYYEASYSNGLITRIRSFKVSEFIPTIFNEL